MIVMCGACFNIMLYGAMSKPKRENETFQELPFRPKVGHTTHRIFGCWLIILGLAACGTGTQITHSDEDNFSFFIGFMAVLGGSLGAVWAFWDDKVKFHQNE
jgi:hypothetical protein